MNKSSHVFSFFLVAVIAFIVGYSIAPRAAIAPETSTNIIPGSQLTAVTLVNYDENASTSPSISIQYPQFPSLAPELNTAIASSVMSHLTEFRQEVTDNETSRKATASSQYPAPAMPLSAYSFIASWEQASINDRYLSLVMHYGYYTGGANGGGDIETFNYDLTRHSFITLNDLFGANPDYLQTISTLVRQDLDASLRAASPGYDPTMMLDEGTTPIPDNFSHFTFNDNTITFYFPKYAVAAGAFGDQKSTVTRSSI